MSGDGEQYADGGKQIRWALPLVIGVLIGATAAGGYFYANPAVETEYETVYSTVEKPVSDNGTVFSLRSGYESPQEWDFPSRVEFKVPQNGTWETRYMATVNENDHFVVDLNQSQRYQIAVTDPAGRQRVLGTYRPTGGPQPVELVMFPCCTDEFPEEYDD